MGCRRRAYGNTLWAARFESAEIAGAAAPRIAAAARLTAQEGGCWRGKQPHYGYGDNSPGETLLWLRGEWLLMCTLPPAAAKAIADATTSAAP